MGFFSQDCNGCGHAVISPYSASDRNAWMVKAVILLPSGSIIRGTHDGYGTVDGREYAIGEKGEVWHDACWKVSGSPVDYTAESRHSHDQGYFFDDAEYDFDPPSSPEDLERMRAIAEQRIEENRIAWEQAMADFKARKASAEG